MKLMKRNRKIQLLLVGFLLLAALPAASLAQGRGRGQEKKIDRFVNGQDARAGRWDRRGPRYPRRTLIGNDLRQRRLNRYRNRDFEQDRFNELNNRRSNRDLRMRRRNLNNDQFLRSQRTRRWHRSGW